MQGKTIANTLPQKELNLFKQLIKFYETKQYKKGLKQSDKILETYHDHPETSSMKGLFLYLTDKQDDGVKLAKAALMRSLKSEICWHIYGIINRNMRNYAEAVKCYQSALRIDPDNGQILKDMSLLQVQIRDIDGLFDTRLKLLQNVPKQPTNWIAFAVANHLKEDYKETLNVLSSFWKVVGENELKPYDKSELYLYEAMIMEEMGDYEGVINHLKKNEKQILDKIAFYEALINNLLKKNRAEEALPYVKSLLDMNPDNHDYHDLLLKTKNPEDKVAFFDSLAKDYPQSTSIKMRRLQILNGEKFKEGLHEYIKPYYEKAQPSLFSEIKCLYSCPEKVALIQEVLLESEQNAANGPNPCCQLWSFMLLSQHFDHLQDYAKALDYLEKAIKHTPTLIELYLIKAKIFKHLRNFAQAEHWANFARRMDLADRYLNNKGIKYSLLNNKIQEADALIKLFLRDPSDGNVHDLQTMWFEMQVGKAYLRQNEFGPGLRQIKFIEKHFNDMYEDQFDFHTYCLRRYTLRAYMNLLRFEDNLYQNKTFMKASLVMMNGLIDYNTHKIAEETKKKEEEGQEKKKLTGAEKKRQKKEEEKKKQQEENDPNREVKKKLDLDGSKFLSEMKSPFEEAQKFAIKVLDLNHNQNKKLGSELLVTCFKVFLLGKKFGLALKTLKKLIKLNYDEVAVHDCKMKFLHFAETGLDQVEMDPSLKAVIKEEVSELSQGKQAKDLNDDFMKTHNSVRAKLLGQRHWFFLYKSSPEALFAKYLEVLRSAENLSLNDGVFLYDYFKREVDFFQENKKEIQEKLSKMFPLSPFFVDPVEEKPVVAAPQEEDHKTENP